MGEAEKKVIPEVEPQTEQDLLLERLDKLPEESIENQKKMLKELANPKCTGKNCFGRGYTGVKIDKNEDKTLLDDNGDPIKEIRTVLACYQKDCAGSKYTELKKAKYLKDRNKLRKEQEDLKEKTE